MKERGKSKLPVLANWLASKFIDESFSEEFLGDLKEIYEERLFSKGKSYANWMYWIDVLHLLIGFSSSKLFKRQRNYAAMHRHYFIIASRDLLRNKGYSFINIGGLAVGIGVCLVISQYIYFELSYDKFHPDVQNTYRVTQNVTRQGEDIRLDIFHTHALGKEGKETIPEIRDVVRIRPAEYDEGVVVTNTLRNKGFLENDVWYVDDTFLQMFGFSLSNGDPKSALSHMNNVVITERMAVKYFGDTNPMGKNLKVSGGSLSGNFTVSGVVKVPENTHMQFDFLLSIEFLLGHYGLYQRSNGWEWSNFLTYVSLTETADYKIVGEKFDNIIKTHLGDDLAQSNTEIRTGFEPIADIHLRFDYDLADRRFQNVLFFTVIAIFILTIAWVNYINLSTARAIHRAKEVGIRKSLGASKKQLISQFLFESLLVNCIAAIIAIGLAYLLLPFLSQMIDKKLEFNILFELDFWLRSALILCLGSMIAGIYPALVLSNFRPFSVIKSAAFKPKNKLSLRKGLILFQFLCSLFLISGTYLVFKQITFMKQQDLGIDMSQILVVPGPRVIQSQDRLIGDSRNQTFKTNVVKHHSIEAITGTSNVPGMGAVWTGEMRKLGDAGDSNLLGNAVLVDANFTRAYDFEFIAGEEFDEDMASFAAVIINEEAVSSFGLGSPKEALDESIILSGVDTLRVHGVVKNVHWNSLRDAQLPTIFGIDHSFNAYLSIKMNLSDIPKTLTYIESLYRETFPNDPFDYFFLDDVFNRQYQADVQFGNLFFAFTALAIVIACIGLFALVSYSATLRIKEIGIRKVLGAHVVQLMMLLSKEYFVLLSLAIVIATPGIIYWGNAWLDNYAFRANLGFDIMVIPALILILISILTVSHRTYTTAKSNPVNSLKTE